MMINKTVDSLSSKEKRSPVIMGRGGFFAELSHQIPNKDDLVSFDIKIKNNEPAARVQGQGRVRWVRTEDGDLPKGVGVEIEYIDETCRQAFVDWVIKQNFVSYIPK